MTHMRIITLSAGLLAAILAACIASTCQALTKNSLDGTYLYQVFATKEEDDSFAEWLYKWQTLVSGIIALVAAGITAWFMFYQTKEGRRGVQEQIDTQAARWAEERERKQLAAQAMLPADLSTICSYAEDCAIISTNAMHHIKSRCPDPFPDECPELPERVFANLQVLIEHLDTQQAKIVADLIACYQIQRSRLDERVKNLQAPTRGVVTAITTENNVEFTLIRTIELHARASYLFQFARREVTRIDHPAYQEENIRSAIISMKLDAIFDKEFLTRTATSLIDAVQGHKPILAAHATPERASRRSS
jgi:hypothetical protein